MEFSHYNKAFTLNVPEWFARKDFLDAVDNNNIMTWRDKNGQEAGEYDDVIVFVDGGLGEFNEGSEQGVLPEDIWFAIVAQCRLHIGPSNDASHGMITVRLTNLDSGDASIYPETDDTLTWSTDCGNVSLALPRQDVEAIANGIKTADDLAARPEFVQQIPPIAETAIASRVLGDERFSGEALNKALLVKACSELKSLLGE